MDVTGKEGPILCAVVGRTRHKMVQVEIQEAAKHGAKLVEVRLDFLAKAPDFKRLLENKPCPLLATVRRPQDGGRWAGSEEQRLVLLRQAIIAGFDWVDLEVDVIDLVRRFGNVKRIVSYHNMRETPADLEDLYNKMCQQDADIVKLAVTAQDPMDNLRVMKLLQGASKPTVAFCMGDLGACTRVLSAKFGAPFTYSAFNKERNIAPGLLSFAELRRIYTFEKIKNTTEVFGVIGDPIGHSMSPLIHNVALHAKGLDAVYVPFRVPRGDLEKFLTGFESIPVQGYSVTLPHKEAAAQVAKWRDHAVEKIGAANTLVRSPQGWRAYNTDAPAAIASLQENLPADATGVVPPLSSRIVLILGAGGVARAVAHALQIEGASVVIANRTIDHGEKLASEVGCRVVDWAARHSVTCDVVINCTPVGMFPNVDDSPLHNSFLKPGLVVFDTIYNPETTLLVREARKRDCEVITGVDMFIRQAALQFKLFTTLDPPIDLMRQTMQKALSPVNLGEDDTRI